MAAQCYVTGIPVEVRFVSVFQDFSENQYGPGPNILPQHENTNENI